MKTEEEKKEYMKLYYEKNKEKLLLQTKIYNENNKEKRNEKAKIYFENNKEKINLKNKEYYQNNKKKHKELTKQWRINNKEKISLKNKEWIKNNKENIYQYRKERTQSDPLFKLRNNLRTLIGNSIKNKGYKKLTKTELILGCSFQEFKSHLESKFESWMSWDNHGKYNGELNYGWDIDHIVPVSSATTEEEVIKLNHYTNLQPLCSKINRDIKKDKLYFIN
jgi:hypothetical protein